VFSIVPAAGVPRLLGTSRHVVQGSVDVIETTWNGDANALSGRSRVVENDWYELRINAPRHVATNGSIEPAERGSEITLAQAGEFVRARFKPAKTGEVLWTITFTPESA
jgi:hypothetical protein